MESVDIDAPVAEHNANAQTKSAPVVTAEGVRKVNRDKSPAPAASPKDAAVQPKPKPKETWAEWKARHKMKRGGESIGPDLPAVKANLMTVGIGWVVMTFMTPSIDKCAKFELDWVLPVLLRTFLIGFVIYEGVHYLMYKKHKGDGTYSKFNKRWPPESQHWRDRKFTCMSFVINGMMECILLQAWASGKLPYATSPNWIPENPWTQLALFVSYPFWRDIHFFLYHFPMHFEPLYKWIHAHHHRSWNTGPWSGLSMTPLESSVTFTGPMIPCLLFQAHPLLFYYANMLAFVNPVYGHHGHEEFAGSYFHYLHHSRVTCNYAMTFTPVDLLIGTWCAGEAEEQFIEKAEKERPEGWTPKSGKWGELHAE